MSYLTTTHPATITMCVPEWRPHNQLLVNISDWLFLDPGYYARNNNGDTPEHHRMCNFLEQYFDGVLAVAKKELADFGVAVLVVFKLCRLEIRDLTRGLSGDRYFQLTFSDFNGKPHHKYAEDFARITGAGLNFTAVSFKHPIPYGDRCRESNEISIYPENILRTLETFFTQIGFATNDDWKASLYAIIDGAPSVWSMPTGIDITISPKDVKRIIRRHDHRQSWSVEPEVESGGKLKPPLLLFVCEPGEKYDPKKNTHTTNGQSLFGFARTLSGILDIVC